MSRHRVTLALLFLSLFASPFATSQTVAYLEGRVEVRESGSWRAARMGDELSRDATLRLGENGFLKLTAPSGTVTIWRAGEYELAELVGAAGRRQQAGFGSLLMSRFQSMRERARPEEGEGTHAGVRASEAAEADEDIGWAGAPTSAELIADGISALEEGDAEGAVSAFDEARTYAESDLAENEALFYLGYAYSPQGDLREAIRSLRQTDLPTDSPLYHDRIVTLGQLYVDTFAYGEAAKLLTEYLDSGAIGAAADETRQDALLVLGLARLGTEDTERARARLEAAREINPESPAGTAADRVLRGL